MESNVVDGVTRIILPGRKWGFDQRLDTDSPLDYGRTSEMPCFVAGPENRLVAAIIKQMLPNELPPQDARREIRPDLPLGLAPGLSRRKSQRETTAHGSASPSLAPFSPLVLLGSTGCGKTHLARGLANRFVNKQGHHRVALFSAVEFGRHLAEAIKDNQLGQFRNSLDSLHLFVIEDLHLIRPGTSVQQELRLAIDNLTDADCIVLVTSQIPLVSVRTLEPGLRDRLTSGLTIRLQQPQKAARLAIVQMAASARGTQIDSQHANLLAERVDGPTTRIFHALLQYEQDPPSAPSAATGRSPAMRQIVAVVARYYSIPQKVLQGPSRRRSAVQARNVAIFLTRAITKLSYSQIGQALGNRDHSTIMHATKRVNKQLATDPLMQEAVDDLKRLLVL